MLDNIAQRKKDIAYRALSFLLSSIFFANIPLLLFLIYMRHHGFFSYDFFADGVFGLQVFFFLTLFIIFSGSMLMFGFIVPIIRWWKKKKLAEEKLKKKVLAKEEPKKKELAKEGPEKREFSLFQVVVIRIKNWWFIIPWQFLFILFVNVVMWALIVNEVSSLDQIRKLFFISALSFITSIHIGFMLYAKPSEQIWTLVFLIVSTTFVSMNDPKMTSSLLSNGLKKFGVGGGVEVNLVPELEKDTAIKGELLLLSPKHIYVRPENSSEVTIIERSRFDVITTNRKLSHEKDAAEDIPPSG